MIKLSTRAKMAVKLMSRFRSRLIQRLRRKVRKLRWQHRLRMRSLRIGAIRFNNSHRTFQIQERKKRKERKGCRVSKSWLNDRNKLTKYQSNSLMKRSIKKNWRGLILRWSPIRCIRGKRGRFREVWWSRIIRMFIWCSLTFCRVLRSMFVSSFPILSIATELNRQNLLWDWSTWARKSNRMIPCKLKLYISTAWWTRTWLLDSKCMIRRIFTILWLIPWKLRVFV